MNMEGEKIKMNLLKLSHSIIVSCLSSVYLYSPNTIIKNLIFFISSSYFSYDTKLLLSRETIDYPILYHHIIALLLLFGFWINYYRDVLIYLYNLGEISNIPMYTTYHLRKTSSNIELTLCSNIIQTIVYGYLRIYCFTDFIIKNPYLIYTRLTPLLGIYLMGWVWFITLCKQILDERITIRYIIYEYYDNLIQNE